VICVPLAVDILSVNGTLLSVNTKKPYMTTCPDCGDDVEVFPDFQSDERCGPCYLKALSKDARSEHRAGHPSNNYCLELDGRR